MADEPLTHTDFTEANGGDFTGADFPGSDLTALLKTWFSDVEDHDEPVQRAYVNWRGNRHIARRMNREYARKDFDGRGQGQRLVSQMDFYVDEAAKYRASVPADLIEQVEGAQQEAAAKTTTETGGFEPVFSRR